MTKVKIPQKHFNFYRKVYNYIHHTLDIETQHSGNKELAKRLIGNYLHKHHTQIKEESHLFNDEENKQLIKSQNQVSELEKLHKAISQCEDCFLGKLRKNTIHLPQYSSLPIMVVVDIPSFYDQTQGNYFTDIAGELLKKILISMGIPLEKIYYTSIIKCVSVREIADELDKVIVCKNHFLNEVKLLKPKLIIGFGKIAYDLILFSKENIIKKNISEDHFEENRGKLLLFNGSEIVFSYHPRDLIFDPSLKKETWNDFKPYKDKIKKLLVDYAHSS